MECKTIEHLLTTAQAIALVKKVDRENLGRFALSVRLPAYIGNETNSYFEDGLNSYINLSRKEALKLVGDLLSKTLEERGGRIRIREVSFPDSVGDTRPTFWIG